MQSAVILIVGIALGLLSEGTSAEGQPAGLIVAGLLVGWVYIGAGAVLRGRVPTARTGNLLVLTGVAWFIGGLVPAAVLLHRGPLVQAIVAYPTGRLSTRNARLAVACVYVISLVSPFVGSVLASAAIGGGLVVFGVVTALTLSRGQPGQSVAAVAAIALGAVLLAGAGARLAGLANDMGLLLAYEVVLILTAAVFGVDSLLRQMSGGLLAQLVVDLGDASRSGTVRDRLARAVGDPGLVLGYAAPDDPGRFVDEDGLPVSLPVSGDRSVVSPIVVADRNVGVIIHDPAVLDDTRLVSLVAAAARVALANSRLQASIRTRVVEVDASRARLVQVGDVQRRMIEADIRSGAAKRLDTASGIVDLADARRGGDAELDTIRDALTLARGQLLDFARGVHPVLLTQAGLGPAIDDLARRSAVPVSVEIDVRRVDPIIESTLYFIAAEALANAEKHAGATRVWIVVQADRRTIDLRVDDDGVGGAALRDDGGLRGLTDRVEALGGRLTIGNGRPGTRLAATVPLHRPTPAAASTS
jgi:signal transduction histidine kinase